MGALSHSITPNFALPRLDYHPSYGLPRLNSPCRRSNSARVAKKLLVSAATAKRIPDVDFNDPDWKSKFQKDFERRFNIPHITDIFPDAIPIPSTFCLRMRTPVSEDFAGGYPSDEEWHGYINNNDRVLLKVINYTSPTSAGAECIDPDCNWVEQWVHRAGPREKIYFRPEEVKAAIVTCGGLCPGLNDVIRQIVITLEIYGVKKIVGIPFGYRGFSDKELSEMPLSRKVVQNIHLSGGSLLGVSRGGPPISEIVDSMEERGINMLFVLGGNGTHAGANAIHNECRKRQMRVAVVGVPKTIDNDILLMDKTFGFDTAVEEAQRAINSAYIEAHSAYHGVGIVKLMGRSSGFIAMHASLASGQIDICLIPELHFNLHGPHGVLRHLKYLIETKGSAVICVAEGAGQDFLQKTNAKDASGNTVLGDIGVHIQQEIKKHFKGIGVPVDVKYIDPTYMIRCGRANASDGILCTVLGQNAVHGAFAGYSGITVGICNTHYVYLPIPEVISYPRLVDPNSRMWHRCLTSTGQPDFI
ncbi:ATP-dependent 6-phosphofructokinase 5, chloroplastic-like [Juglans microcarpa x Juglans regia]|uniref:ATP-dependent 6-phosphofructokinase 5, chloroplastic-like n=1 Tax=Juglans microcarpa x Juglans regia TaxID=2249226 RepID=UPI001B7F05D7|nr:ATP-dependent 6-phosphofructokinase 5, chloroplastic-like [Juglans microcarpa x Juglans regia]